MVEKTGSKYFFISNCDTIIQVDLHDLHKFHRVNKNDITIVVSNKKTKIPYGVCMTNKNKVFEEVVEKPELNHIVNTGFYLINSNVVDLVPKKSRTYNFTDLINRAKKLKKKIGIYSTKSKNWIDLGVPSVFQ